MIPISLYISMIENEEDRSKLEQIYKSYKKIMMIVANKHVGKYQVEEDVVHDAIIKLRNYLDRIDLDDPQAVIFIKVVTNSCALDWIKHRFPRDYKETSFEDIPVDLPDETILSPVEQILSEEGYETLVKYVKSINETNRDACELRFIFKMSEKEIADILNISTKNVSVRVLRGRKEIIQKLEEAGYNVERYKRLSNISLTP